MDDEDARYAEAERKVKELERQWVEWQQTLWKSFDLSLQRGDPKTTWQRTDDPRKSFKQRHRLLLRKQPQLRAEFKRRVDWEKKQYGTLASHIKQIWRDFEATAESIVLNEYDDDDGDSESEEDVDFEPVSEDDDSEASSSSA